MRLYLDTSALVKLYVDEEGSAAVRGHVARAELVATSPLAYVEARAAFTRRRREGRFPSPEYRRVVRGLDADWDRYLLVEVRMSVVREAARLAEAHRLRAYDALHLASARVVRDRLGEAVAFASWDADLGAAARREGLVSVGP